MQVQGCSVTRIVRCPVCAASGRHVVTLGWGSLDLGPCLPCAGKGRVQLITLDEFALLSAWLPPAQVGWVRERQRRHSALASVGVEGAR
jgi:hypothetical protein